MHDDEPTKSLDVLGIPEALRTESSNLRERLDSVALGQYVVGVGRKQVKGRFTEQMAVFVYVREKLSVGSVRAAELIPPAINGVATDVVAFRRVDLEDNAVYRPLRGGIQISPPDIALGGGAFRRNPGTIGAVVVGRSGSPHADERLFLTCAHVAGAVGTSIHQPGQSAGGVVIGTTIASRHQEVPVRLDCALVRATPHPGALATIEGISPVKGTAGVVLWETIKKRGAKTLLTNGLVARVVLTSNGAAILEAEVTGFPFDQIIAATGDSGSVIVNSQDEVIGHLTSANAADVDSNGFSTTAMMTPIEYVQNALDVDVLVKPAVTSVNPRTASSALANFGRVSLKGWGFDAGSRVSFGGLPATTLSASASQLDVVMPPSLGGGVIDVRVTNRFGETSDAHVNATFSYVS